MTRLILIVLAINALWLLLSLNIAYQRGWKAGWHARIKEEEARKERAREEWKKLRSV
jgi:hypothetical protein